MIKILIVDDNKIVRSSIKTLLVLNPKFNVVGECNDGETVIPYLKENDNVDIILMDISMPKLNGIEATKLVSKHFPAIKVIAFTMHKQDSYIKNMKKAGAMSYVLKTDDIDVINNTIIATFHSDVFIENIDQKEDL